MLVIKSVEFREKMFLFPVPFFKKSLNREDETLILTVLGTGSIAVSGSI